MQLEKLRGLQWAQAEGGDWKAIERLSLVHDPDWLPLRSAKVDVSVTHEFLARVLPNAPLEAIEALIEAEERTQAGGGGELRMLPPASEG